MFKHSYKDSYLVLIAMLQVALQLYFASVFDTLSMLQVVGVFTLLSFLAVSNYQCVAHNFCHNVFFNSKALNDVFSVINTLANTFPQTLFKYHHFNHHTSTNDKATKYGETKDRTSIYRYSKVLGKQEGFWAYSFKSPLRTSMTKLWQVTREKGAEKLAIIETVSLAAFLAVIFLVSWQFGLLVLLVLYFGQVLSFAENYAEHGGTVNTSNLDNSVSCYARWYNLIWFNNGYHQEHHYRPQVHWTEVPRLKEKMLDGSKRKIVYSHWTRFLEKN
jgi:fatty acid desaturase